MRRNLGTTMQLLRNPQPASTGYNLSEYIEILHVLISFILHLIDHFGVVNLKRMSPC